jgi:hypothetical protein
MLAVEAIVRGLKDVLVLVELVLEGVEGARDQHRRHCELVQRFHGEWDVTAWQVDQEVRWPAAG